MPNTQIKCGDHPPQQIVVSPQTIFLQAPLKSHQIYENYSDKKSLVLGILQICTGVFCILVNIVCVTTVTALAYIAHGFWCGLVFCVAGTVGIAAARMKTRKMILAFMVTSIFSGILSSVLFGISVLASVIDLNYCKGPFADYPYYDNTPIICRREGSNDYMIALGLTMVGLALFEGVFAILSSVICCSVICCGARNTQDQMIRLSVPMVQYAQTGSPQEIVCLTTPQQPLVENEPLLKGSTSPLPEYTSRNPSHPDIHQKGV